MSMRQVAVFNDTRPGGHYGCQLVMRNLIHGLRRHGMEPVWFGPVGRDWRSVPAGAPRAASLGGLIVNGEGSIHGRAGGHLLDVALLAKREGVPAFLLNSTLHDLDGEAVQRLREFSGIFVRESSSAGLLRQRGIASDVVPDLVFASGTAAKNTLEGGVCGTDSVFPDVSEIISRLCAQRGWSYRGMIDPLVVKRRQSGTLRSFASHAIGSAASRLLGRAGPDAYIDFLSNHSLVLTGRFHAVALCLATGTPFLAVESNTPKIRALLSDVLGAAGRVVPLAQLEALGSGARSPWTEGERSSAAAYCAAAPPRIERMFADIRERLR